jgi:cyclopropane-fatty-acyl-phospholipid synthase
MENLNFEPLYKEIGTLNNLGLKNSSVPNSFYNSRLKGDYSNGRFGNVDYLNYLESRKLDPNGPLIKSVAKPLLLRLLNSAPGKIIISDTDGKTKILGQFKTPEINLKILDDEVFGLTLLNQSTGLGVAYANGYFECDDLTQFLQLITKVLRKYTGTLNILRTKTSVVGNKFRNLVHRQNKHVDRSQIHFHYDLSNEFFELMLDNTMSYSCGIFLSPNDTLEAASINKIQNLVDMLELKPTDHLLEIGSGWGGLAMYAANSIGCNITTTTVSRQQELYVKQKVKNCNLQDKVKVLDKDFRDLTGKFDKLVSVEMIEALDWTEHKMFLQKCADLLKPGGKMALQAIVHNDQTYERAKTRKDFIKSVVFPGGCLPSVSSILETTSKYTNLAIRKLEDIGIHYANTLRGWQENLHSQNDRKISELQHSGLVSSNPTFIRYWDFYLNYCRAGFLEKFVSDVQILFEKPAF